MLIVLSFTRDGHPPTTYRGNNRLCLLAKINPTPIIVLVCFNCVKPGPRNVYVTSMFVFVYMYVKVTKCLQERTIHTIDH